MERADLQMIEEIKKLGGTDLAACYSCGACSAVCPLSEGDLSFPRKMIRYALLGLEGRILASPEPWLCYYCGECSKTCPREADPGGLMMALRRLAIRRYSIGRAADVFYSAFASGVAWMILTAVAIAAIFLFYNRGMDRTEVDFLSFISLERIHIAGIAIASFVAAAFLANVWIMYRIMNRGAHGAAPRAGGAGRSRLGAIRETILQERFGECEDDAYRRLAHLGVSWGFMGMLLATAVIAAIDFKWIALPRWTSLAIGSVSGVATILGVAYFGYLRLGRRSEYSKYSHRTDWAFLALVALSVVSGYVMVAFRFMHMPMAAYGTYAFHLVFVFNLLVSLPFTKFAHVLYRPIALWLAGVK
ncbi:MAG: 4Fe-4S dicluster domain-containing protein [Candidatus Krumholzibacteria bacterium]|nr:4Fe-4S dicluster domain-containing protein [Candidatus Krumholzibacteria bacterium]